MFRNSLTSYQSYLPLQFKSWSTSSILILISCHLPSLQCQGHVGYHEDHPRHGPCIDKDPPKWRVTSPSIVYLKDVSKLNILLIVTCNDARTLHLWVWSNWAHNLINHKLKNRDVYEKIPLAHAIFLIPMIGIFLVPVLSSDQWEHR